MPACVDAYIGLGANLGDARGHLHAAVQALQVLPGVTLRAVSDLYASAPIDSSGPDYLNAVVGLQTRLAAPDVLAALQQIESAAGRERPYRNAPRTLDLDLLLYGTQRIESPCLTVPHPRMYERAFVLMPLSELVPAWVPPSDLARVADQRIVRLGPWYTLG